MNTLATSQNPAFAYVIGDPMPPDQVRQVWATDPSGAAYTGPLAPSLSVSVPWLQVVVQNASCPLDYLVQLVNPPQTAGTYTGQFTLSDPDVLNSPFAIAVTLVVTGTPPPNPTNLAPWVNAGPDQTITFPAEAKMNGAVTDDGLPVGATVTWQWSQVSGPAPVSFGNTSKLTSDVNFTQGGIYVLRLTASDTALSSFSEVTITVLPLTPNPPTNVAPVVSAGPDQIITLPATAPMNGSATDDGLPAASLVALWTQISGPAPASFSDPNSPTAVVSFAIEGDYVLELSATDGLLSAADQVSITVLPAVVIPPTGGGDITVPTVQILSTVVGSNKVRISAKAADANNVEKMEVYVEGVLKHTVSGGSFVYDLPTRKYSLSTITLEVTAIDTAGNIGRAMTSVIIP